MNVKQLRHVLKGLPPNMEIMMPVNENKIVNICPDKVLIVGIVLEGKVQEALLLNPCNYTPEICDLVKNLPLN